MKRLKIILSLILVLMLAMTSTVTAFAVVDEEVNDKMMDLLSKAKEVEGEFVYYNSLYAMHGNVPRWSDESTQRLKDVVQKIRTEMGYCETLEEVAEYEAMLDDAVEKMCISSTELQWMLDYMKKDYNNSTNYYDEETYAELKTIYENAQKALESGVDLDIHNAYIDMRNELNKLCEYNPLNKDVDNDGVFSIKDCTLMQMYVSKYVELTSSQVYVAGMNKDANITQATQAQMLLSGLYEYPDWYPYDVYVQLDFVKLDPSVRYYFGTDPGYEQSNAMYHYDRYDSYVPI